MDDDNVRIFGSWASTTGYGPTCGDLACELAYIGPDEMPDDAAIDAALAEQAATRERVRALTLTVMPREGTPTTTADSGARYGERPSTAVEVDIKTAPGRR